MYKSDIWHLNPGKLVTVQFRHSFEIKQKTRRITATGFFVRYR